jgi:5'-methylthioadenosine phosphorylase
MSEAKLAREAEICFVTLASITDYDCWYKPEEQVSLEMVLQNLSRNVDNSKKIIKRVIRDIPENRSCGCGAALSNAIVTDRKLIPAKIKKDLKPIIGKYIH